MVKFATRMKINLVIQASIKLTIVFVRGLDEVHFVVLAKSDNNHNSFILLNL